MADEPFRLNFCLVEVFSAMEDLGRCKERATLVERLAEVRSRLWTIDGSKAPVQKACKIGKTPG